MHSMIQHRTITNICALLYCVSLKASISEPNLDVFLQSWVHVDGVLLYVVDDGAVGDVVVLAGSSGPTVEEEDEDDHQ